MSKFSIFLPSFNKHEYVLNALNSVMNQAFSDWELWLLENSNDDKTRQVVKQFIIDKNDERIKYIEIDFTDLERKEKYPTAVLLNEYYLKANGDFIVYLSDDDILYPNALQDAAGFFQSHSNSSAIYMSQKCCVERSPGCWEEESEIKATNNRGAGTGGDFDCQVDGGQVIHKKTCLELIDQPFFEFDYKDASHCDGLFLNKLGKHFTVEALGSYIGEHRRTGKSAWTR